MVKMGEVRDVAYPVGLKELLDELSALAARLNEEASKASETIRLAEARLTAMNLGVVCWMPTGKGFALGYAKIVEKGNEPRSRRWRLACKEDLALRGTSVPLAEAPRRIRVAAAPLLRSFLKALVRAAEKVVEEAASAQAPTGEGAK